MFKTKKKPLNQLQPKKIAVFRLSALGDCILLIPTIRALQAQFPSAEITWITEKNLMPLLQCVDGVRFFPIQKPRSIKDYRTLKKALKHESFDILLAIQASLRTNLIYPLINAPIKLGFDKARANDLHKHFVTHQIAAKQGHLLDGFMAFATELGVKPEFTSKPQWNLQLPAEDLSWAHSFQKHSKLVVINAAASKEERTPQPEFYSKLIAQVLDQYDCNIVLSGGPATFETSLADAILQQLPQQLWNRIDNLVGKTSLPQIAALLAKCDLLIAPDTGPIHIATAFHRPIIGLYAVAPPELSGPYFCQAMVVNHYPDAVRQFLGKDPATVPFATRVHHRSAMELITCEEVMAQVASVL